MRDQAHELSKILTETNLSIINIGKLLNKGWLYKKSLASKISNKVIDDWYESALRHGASGGKISGAGGGGFFTFIVEPNRRKELSNEMKKQGLIRHSFGFEFGGAIVTKIR